MTALIDKICAELDDRKTYKISSLLHRYRDIFPQTDRSVRRWCETQQIQGAHKFGGSEWLITGGDFKNFLRNRFNQFV